MKPHTMRPLLISVPSYELNRMGPLGSVFDAKKLENAPFSQGLNHALQIVQQALAPNYSKVLCVSRPEMFTHGESLAWLQERTEGAQDHLYLSNGQAMKLLPGFNNSLFVYGLDRQSGNEQFRTLLRRAPELLGEFTQRFNCLHDGPTDWRQPANNWALLQAPLPPSELSWYYPFYMNRHSNNDSAERMLRWGSSEPPPLAPYRDLRVFWCGEAALHDQHFCHALGQAVIETSRQPHSGLMLVMPTFENEEGGILQRMGSTIDGLRRSGLCIPRVRIDNVMLMTDLPEGMLHGLPIPFELNLHETAPMWQYTHDFYAQANTINLYTARQLAGASPMNASHVETLLGKPPTMRPWTPEFMALQGIV